MTSRSVKSKDTISKVLIAEDHPICRRGLIRLVEEDECLSVCGEAESTDEALRQISGLEPDLVTIDLSLKSSSGIDLIKTVRARYGNRIRMIVMSMHEEPLLIERAIRSGARGYVNKREVVEHLVPAIRNVLEGKFYMSEETREKTLQNEFGIDHENSMTTLSDRELEIFQLIGEGMTTGEIAKSLHLSVKTVEGYRAGIRRKLKLKDNMELIRQAVKWTKTSQAAESV